SCWAGLAALLLSSSTALAQEGAEAPAQSFSLQDDGTALAGNPGGLAFTHGLELNFLHNGLRQIDGHTEALYGSLGAGNLTAAGGVDWIRRTGVSARRLSLGLG